MDRSVSERPVAVIGAGAWGTTLAWLLGSRGRDVRLWCRRPEQAAALSRERENRLRLPGTRLPDGVQVSSSLVGALQDVGHVIMAVPSAHLREVARQMAPWVPQTAVVVSATKGLEASTGQRMSQVLIQECRLPQERVLALSGPNLSAEIVAGMPAVSAIAGTDEQTVIEAQRFFATPLFRLYASYDILGVEVCGALKNVIAIAAGICEGLGYGANAKAALVTRGLAEMGRIGTRLGARRATFWGVAGVGDVLATCNSPLSRNWQLGFRLGRGEDARSAGTGERGVAEGVPTTAAARGLARQLGVETPIVDVLYEILFSGLAPADGVRELMSRPLRAEPEQWQ